MSHHHCSVVTAIIVMPILSSIPLYWWNHLIIPIIVTSVQIAPVRGQGLLSAR
jgi:hypothetical protein